MMKYHSRQLKQILSLVCALLLLVFTSACGGKQQPVDDNSQSSTEDYSSDETQGATQPSGEEQTTGNNGGRGGAGKTSSNNKTDSTKNTTSTNKGGKTPYTNDNAFDTKGYVFTIASAWLKSKSDHLDTGFESLFFERKAEVEKMFNCTIKIINFNPTVSNLQPKILAGDKVADIVEMVAENWISAAANNFIVPMESIEGININDSRWISAYKKLTEFKGKHWGLQFLKPVEVRACVFFNKDLIKASGIKEDLYQLVRDKKWTFDKFGEICLKVAKDTNNDGVNDIWGMHMVHPLDNIHYFLQANNGALVKVNSKGKVEESFTSKEAVNTLTYLHKWAQVDKTMYMNENYRGPDSFASLGFEDSINLFTTGKVAFLIDESWICNQQLKTKVKNFEYGMLPLPMGPDAKDYVSPAQNARAFAITSTNKDLKYTVPIFNALAKGLKGYEGEDWMWEDIQKEYFQDSDKQSIEMYKLCLSKSSVDIGVAIPRMLEEWRMYAGVYSVFFRTETPQSAGNKITGKYDTQINKLFNK